tara:strand:- start:3194 stop:3655 length:462 start_codon:yes stop_codon:yes gene_type:complete
MSYLTQGLLAFSLLASSLSWGQASTGLLEQLKFAAVELLIYTDQLQRFERTACNSSVVSNYASEVARQQLLRQLRSEHRAEFQQLFESAQVAQLLQENKAGIEALLGPQRLLGGDRNLDPKQRAACQELGEVFQDNYLQTQQDLQLLFDQYSQ